MEPNLQAMEVLANCNKLSTEDQLRARSTNMGQASNTLIEHLPLIFASATIGEGNHTVIAAPPIYVQNNWRTAIGPPTNPQAPESLKNA